jgi:tetratricopeptide (TPR) repeat protein
MEALNVFIDYGIRHFAKIGKSLFPYHILEQHDGFLLIESYQRIASFNFTEADAAKVEHALRIEPDDAQLMNLLGEIEKRRGDYSKADSLFRRAVARFEELNEQFHLTITRTAMADNLRKWAEPTSDAATAASYLSEGYRIMTEATSTDSSPRAQATMREIAFALGRSSEREGKVANAIRYYGTSISWQPIRQSDKRKAVTAAMYIADHLLRAERRDDARRYLDLVRTYCRPEELKQLDSLELDYEQGPEFRSSYGS